MTAGDVATELAALRRITNTLDALDEPTRARTMRWLHDRYDLVAADDHVDSAVSTFDPTQPTVRLNT